MTRFNYLYDQINETINFNYDLLPQNTYNNQIIYTCNLSFIIKLKDISIKYCYLNQTIDEFINYLLTHNYPPPDYPSADLTKEYTNDGILFTYNDNEIIFGESNIYISCGYSDELRNDIYIENKNETRTKVTEILKIIQNYLIKNEKPVFVSCDDYFQNTYKNIP